MRDYSVKPREKLHNIDYVLLICAVLIAALSILTLFAASDKLGTRRVIIQSVAMGIGVVCFFLFSLADYDAIFQKITIPLFGVSLLLMVITVLFGTGEGNQSWLRIPGFPVDIQPSEFVKLFFIISFARHIDYTREKINHIKSVAGLAVHAGIIIGLVVLTGDLGSGLVFISMALVMLFVAGLSIWYFIGGAAVTVVAFPFLWDFLSTYQQQRILVGFNPDADPQGYGYQAILSRKAIASGGLFGQGFSGGSVYKELPVAESDFLFAVMNEKFGLISSIVYFALMAVLIIRILHISYTCRKRYGSLICVGVAAVLIAQTVENAGMCLALLPVVGITLPFFSYGGSSMLASFLMLAVVGSIKSHNRKYFFERELR